MKKYTVYGIMSASFVLGEYEANSEDEAQKMAEQDQGAAHASLCHQCAHQIDLGDVYETQAEESN